MKTLTLTQPWATLVAVGAKRIETRCWKTSYRGPLAIHAAKDFPRDARDFSTCNLVRRVLALKFGDSHFAADAYPLGRVLATCRLTNVLPTEVVDNADNVFSASLEPLGALEWAFGDYSPGRFAWILEDVAELPEPEPAKGALSLWDWDAESYWKLRDIP